jgi:signal transduction histidine kinase
MDTPKPESGAPDHALHQDALDLLQVMGQSLSAALLYGLNHKVTAASLEVSFRVATKFMEYHGPIDFSIENHLLLINGVSTGGSPVAGNFITRLTGLQLLNVSLQPGFPATEYVKFFEILLTPASKLGDQSGADLVQSLGFKHVQAKAFSYQRVSGEGTGSEPATQAANDIRSLASDPEKLADLILKTVESRPGLTLPENEETLIRLISDCIQKVTDQLLTDPALKTQKGRKQTKRSLLLLEKALTGRLEALTGESSARALTARLTELAEELDLEALANQYMKGRRAAGKASEKLGHLIDRIHSDPDQLAELQERLIADGLTAEGWQELTDRPNGAGTTASPEIQDLIAETAKQLSLLSRLTTTRLSRLRDKLGTEDTPRQLSRRDVLEILAELTQEISQPLTIVNATIELIMSLRVGPLNDSQQELLGMVAESGDRMAQLVDSLMRIAGTPSSLHPDQAILKTAYSQG